MGRDPWQCLHALLGSDSDLFSYPSLHVLPTIYIISQPGLTFSILSQQMSLDLCR